MVETARAHTHPRQETAQEAFRVPFTSTSRSDDLQPRPGGTVFMFLTFRSPQDAVLGRLGHGTRPR